MTEVSLHSLERTRRLIRLGISVGCLVVAGAVFAWLVATAPRPVHRPMANLAPRVEVHSVSPVVLASPIVGYGTVRPKRQVKVIPEVGGRLVKVHGDLAVGNIIAKGALLFEIDDRVYQSRVAQAEAEIARLEAELARHHQQQKSLAERLAVAQRQMELAEASIARDRTLHEEGTFSLAKLEQSEEAYLQQRDVLLTHQNQAALIPHQIAETEALLETKRTQLLEAKLNVEKTKIYCPFEARVDSVRAQESQVVVASFHIATLTDMEALEIVAVIDPRELRWTDQKSFASALGPDLESAPDVRVTWTLRGQAFSWSGKVTRLERVDEVTRSAHMVVEVRDFMLNVNMGAGQSRPPLSVGMFCRAEIPTQPLTDALLVPRYAIRDNAFVYVFKPDQPDSLSGTLGIKRVPILRTVGQDVLVSYRRDAEDEAASQPPCELVAGDQVVLSPLPKAVEGMRLTLKQGEVMTAAFAAAPGSVSILFSVAPRAFASIKPPLLGAIPGAR